MLDQAKLRYIFTGDYGLECSAYSETTMTKAQEPTSDSLTRSSFAAMAGVLLSRASGVIRTIVVNSSFGAATALDAFNAAFRFPNALRDLFADGALSAAFMTALVENKHRGLKEEKKLIGIVVGFFGTLTLLLAAIGAYYAHSFVLLITDERFQHSGGLDIAVALFRVLAFYLPITMLNAVVMAILGVLGQSFRAMNGSIFLSVGMIVGVLFFSPLVNLLGYVGIMGLAIGAMLGAVLQMLYQLRPIVRLGLFPIPNFNPIAWYKYQPLHRIVLQMVPRALGQGALTLALAVNTYFATQIGVGVLTYIVTTVIIIQVPIGLFGVATGFAALPVLTKTINENQIKRFSQLLTTSLQTTLWLALLTTLGLALLVVPFYIVLFQHGRIVFHDTIYNCIAICSYSIGILFASGSKVLVNTLYALNATRQIVYNAFIYLIVNATLSFLLAPKFGVVGLGLSFGCATAADFWLNYFIIARIVRTKHNYYLWKEDRYINTKLLVFSLLSFAIGILGVELIRHFWVNFGALAGFNLSFWWALLILIAGGLIITGMYVVILHKFGPLQLKHMLFGTVAKLLGKDTEKVAAKKPS